MIPRGTGPRFSRSRAVFITAKIKILFFCAGCGQDVEKLWSKSPKFPPVNAIFEAFTYRQIFPPSNPQ